MTGYLPDRDRRQTAVRRTSRAADNVYAGPPLPTFNASLGNTFRYGESQFYALLTMERGAVFQNSDRPYRVRQGGADEYPAVPQLQRHAELLRPTRSFNYWSLLDAVDSRDNVRIRELSLSYTIPSSLTARTNLADALTLVGAEPHVVGSLPLRRSEHELGRWVTRSASPTASSLNRRHGNIGWRSGLDSNRPFTVRRISMTTYG